MKTYSPLILFNFVVAIKFYGKGDENEKILGS